METGLQLLMRDGKLHIRFHPKLTAQHYAELLEATETPETKAELRAVAEALAKRWGSDVQFEEV